MILTKPYMVARKNNGVLFEPDANTVLWLPGQDDPKSATLRDRSGAVHNGVITGATWTQTPRGLWYLDFDGSDDKVIITATSALNITTAMSMVLWTRRDGAQSANDSIMMKGDVQPYGIRMRSTDSCKFDIAGSGSDVVNLSVDLTNLTWIFLVATFDGTDTINIYRNGALDSTATPVTQSAGGAADVGIASDGAGDSNFYKGGIALPRLISRELSLAEITSLYNQERHLFGV